jgi:3-hydroxyisobutyrate dehydrogenase-like beta-hydroxyacid dehydrogenase
MAAQPLRVAVLGLGEAGTEISRDLVAAGVDVRGYDPLDITVPGVTRCDSEASAATGADVILSVNSASAATTALRYGLPGTSTTAIWADLNTSGGRLKRELAARCDSAGVAFADVAMMAPVPGKGLRVPMLVCGNGAATFTDTFRALGGDVDILEGPPGSAADRKLVRSVFFKGMAAAVIEALAASRAAGCEEWLRDNITEELSKADASTLDRLERGTHKHAVRRAAEMVAATDLLTDLGVPAPISAATAESLSALAKAGNREPPTTA